MRVALLSGLLLPGVVGEVVQCQSWCPGTIDRPIIVVGGGMSGVSAASRLQKQGCVVKLVEAKQHLGGRTYGEVQEGGWTFNHGANWIHGAHPNPLWDLNEKEHLVRTQWLPRTYYTVTSDGVERDAGNDTYVPGQEMRDEFDDFSENHARFQQWLTMTCQGKPNSLDLPLTYFVREYLASKNMSATELDEFLLYYNAYETLDYAVDLYSASMVNQLGRLYNHDKEHMVADPYNKVVEFFAEGIDVTLGMAVDRIEYDESGVVVHARNGTSLKGSIAIVTVPLGVLQATDLSFLPPLPPWKQRTISGMNMGLLEKVAFEFEEPWWESAGVTEDAFWTVKKGQRDGFKSTASEWYNLHNLLNKTVPPVLLTTPGGYFADYLEYESDEKVIAVFMAELQTIFPDVPIPQPKRFMRTFHRQDEFMRGSYSSPLVGTDPLSMNFLAEPVGNRLFFAGEATSTTRFGYADGAHDTGLRAAKQVVDLCSSATSTVPFDSTGLTSLRPPRENEIRREWKAEVEKAIGISISDCDELPLSV